MFRAVTFISAIGAEDLIVTFVPKSDAIVAVRFFETKMAKNGIDENFK